MTPDAKDIRMRNRNAIALLLSLGTILAAAPPVLNQGDLLQRAKAVFVPLPKVIVSPDNPITPEKTRLGKMLFYDTRISVDRTVSCFKCHWINLYATDGLPRAIGNNYKLNPRNAPTVFNAAGQIAQHWIGNRTSVEDQAKQSLIGPPSYGLASYDDATKRLQAIPGYRPLFEQAFPGDEDPVNADNFAKAVGAWERTLVTPARFDDFLQGDTQALSGAGQTGLSAFIETGCGGCHRGAYVGGRMYAKFGIKQPYANLTHSKEIDVGRYAVTNKEQDRYVFKVPMLRNVEMTSPYFHDGSVSELADAVRIMAQLQLGVTLDDDSAASIVTFLQSLTGSIPDDALQVPLLPPED
jgi:cytochrome c peroxidase